MQEEKDEMGVQFPVLIETEVVVTVMTKPARGSPVCTTLGFFHYVPDYIGSINHSQTCRHIQHCILICKVAMCVNYKNISKCYSKCVTLLDLFEVDNRFQIRW